uniref:Rhodanese domain-containing protein n=1 Tax=Lotharella oceanica TaxID=641309 RepID=A0A7S2XC71_9EUKA|mmetsp:Transcript_25953/g.48393  ORF Transcript_25953/g.48393 Transcript_25953/m.48393 type:complete len:102 (+) Transcript_25953:258-563(+)
MEPLPQIVDVRNGFEYRGGHVQGAKNCQYLLPCGFVSRIEKLDLDESKPVYVICLSAHRSIGAVRALQSLGYDARHLKGGMQAWRKAKYVETTTATTTSNR